MKQAIIFIVLVFGYGYFVLGMMQGLGTVRPCVYKMVIASWGLK